MLKRKFGNHQDWQRITKRRYAQEYLDTDNFTGYVTLIDMVKVSEPLHVSYGEREVCLVDDGYMWLRQFPFGNNHTVTTTFDQKGNIVQWYIDICQPYEVENGVPIIDDLFLDIVILPTGEVFLLDEDELEEALDSNVINRELYRIVWQEAKRLMKLIEENKLKLLELADVHRNSLVEVL
ncbi:DUF402 domain-containing protein [Paucisalibacillus globulus]|uniref:DUF402 domain-containing protein n=1 Tax=Paucisalibacillus globulus TaxID=351095 RepID=UPI000422B873|nr:DUF402 domain-containing protein [Paucisalibacillus globulus]